MFQVLGRNIVRPLNYAAVIRHRGLTNTINFKELQFESKVPEQPTPLPAYTSHRVTIDTGTIRLLERLSLVNVEDE